MNLINKIIRYFTLLGNMPSQLMICVYIFLIIDTYKGICIGISWYCGYLVNLVLKNVIKRPRPHVNTMKVRHVNGYSFPSGHSFMSIILYGLIYYYFSNKELLIYLLIVMPLLMGLSRLFLKVHYLSDIVGGWILGSTSIYLIIQYLLPFIEFYAKQIICILTAHNLTTISLMNFSSFFNAFQRVWN